MTHYFFLHLAILGVEYYFTGIGGVKFQLVYTLLGMFWMEMVNYIEHYGLRRRKDSNGVYESIGY